MRQERAEKSSKRESYSERNSENMNPRPAKIKSHGDKHSSHTDNTHSKHSKSDHKEKDKSKHKTKEKQNDKSSKNSSTDVHLNRKDNAEELSKASRKNHKHSRKRTKDDGEEDEESYEELSNRKKRIELELRALDEEEAAEAQHKRPKRDHLNHHHHRHHDRNTDNDVKPIRIKTEPVTDDESNRRRNHNERHNVRQRSTSNHERHTEEFSSRIKQEPSSPRSNRRPHQGKRKSNSDNMEWGKPEHSKLEKKNVKDKEKPNFEPSGKLAEDTNTYNGVVIKYNEPNEARKPRRKWRLYPFKGNETLPFIPIYRQSAYLLGRSRLIADIPIDHPSCSKQHAVLQFRLTPYTKEDGTKGRSIRPYVIDLDSSNGTFVNNKKIDPRRYVELFEKDVLKFGFSSRVYVILHEDSKTEDVNDEDELRSLTSEEEEVEKKD